MNIFAGNLLQNVRLWNCINRFMALVLEVGFVIDIQGAF